MLYALGEPLWTLVQLDRILYRERIDVVHLHTLQDYHWYFATLARLGRCRYVVTLHRNETLEYSRRPPAQRDRWARTLAGADSIVAVSETLAKVALERLPLDRPPTVVRNGIREVVIRECGRQMNAGTRYVICVGALSKYKGHDTVIRAWAEVLRSVPNVELVIAGSGELRDELETLSKEVSNAAQIHLLGALPHDEVVRWVAGACAYLMPSRSEGLPIALLEAAALGKPLVVSDLPVFREVVSHGIEGLLVPVDDVGAWAKSITAILTDREMSKRMAANARARYEAEFRAARMADEYCAIYAELAL